MPRRADPVMHAYALLLGAQVAMASGGIFARFALREIGPLTVAAARMALVAAPLALRWVWGVRRLPASQEMWLAFAGIALGAHFAGWTGALLRLSVGMAILLVCTTPLWNGLYEALILRVRLPRSFWLALGVALLGIFLLAYDTGHAARRSGEVWLGVLMGIGSSLGTTAYLIVIHRVATGGPRVSTLDIITRTYGWAAVCLVALSAAAERQTLPPLHHWQPWCAVLGMALVTQGIGHTLQNAALPRLTASVVGFVTLVEPLLATLLAVWIFHEAVTWRMASGGILVIAGLAWALRGHAQRPRSQSRRLVMRRSFSTD